MLLLLQGCTVVVAITASGSTALSVFTTSRSTLVITINDRNSTDVTARSVTASRVTATTFVMLTSAHVLLPHVFAFSGPAI